MKVLLMISHSGAFSRRKAFDAIRRGAVTVNGQVVVEPSTEVDPVKAEVICCGRLIGSKRFEYVVLNKPQGVVTTCEGQFGQKTVLDLLPKELRHLRPVGRLDKDTEGLLFLTNDGELANKLMHPGFDVDKTYLVRVRWNLIAGTAQRLERGIMLGGQKTSPATVKILQAGDKESEIEMTIHEGRKRQVRLMMDSVGHPVVYLKRLRQGPVALGNLEAEKWRRLTEEEVARLRQIMPKTSVPLKPHVARVVSEFRREEKPLTYVARRGAERGQTVRRETGSNFSPSSRRAEALPDKERGRKSFATARKPGGASDGLSSRRFGARTSNKKTEDRTGRVPGDYPLSGDRKGSYEARRAPVWPAGPRPVFSSREQIVRNEGTRQWHSDSDVHAPSARASVRPPFRPRSAERGASYAGRSDNAGSRGSDQRREASARFVGGANRRTFRPRKPGSGKGVPTGRSRSVSGRS